MFDIKEGIVRPGLDLFYAERKKQQLVGVEVGFYRGLHALEMLENMPNIHLHLVDNLSKQHARGRFFAEVKERLSAYEGRITYHIKTSEEALKDFKGYSLDFVYIDAGHDYDSVKFDLNGWHKKVKIGGLVAGHDFDTRYFPGVVKAATEFAIDHKLSLNSLVSYQKDRDCPIECGFWYYKLRGINIVIATHNGGDHLRACIESLLKIAVDSRIKVHIINNLSTDSYTLWLLKNCPFKVYDNDNAGYDTGAYIYAIDKIFLDGRIAGNFPDLILFCHDDVIFKPDFYETMVRKMDTCDVLALTTFKGCWDSDKQKQICMDIVGMKEFEEKIGIFGPIFMTSAVILQKAKDAGLLKFIPKDKLEQQAMERGWGYIFDKVGAKIDALVKWPGEALNENNHDSVIVHRLQVKQ